MKNDLIILSSFLKNLGLSKEASDVREMLKLSSDPLDPPRLYDLNTNVFENPNVPKNRREITDDMEISEIFRDEGIWDMPPIETQVFYNEEEPPSDEFPHSKVRYKEDPPEEIVDAIIRFLDKYSTEVNTAFDDTRSFQFIEALWADDKENRYGRGYWYTITKSFRSEEDEHGDEFLWRFWEVRPGEYGYDYKDGSVAINGRDTRIYGEAI